MTTPQKNKTAAKTYTRDDAEYAAREYTTASVKLDNLTSRLNARIQKIREEYADEIAALQEVADSQLAIVQAWADDNAPLFFKKKSLELVHAIVGYRTSTPSLKTIRGVTWAKAIALIEAIRPDFLRKKVEVDKEAIIAQRDALQPEGLKALGVRIDQAERFFMDPKKDTIKLTE